MPLAVIVLKILFLGRFEPFHKGHLHAIKHILGKYDSVVLAIGSANQSRTKRNPFSYAERRAMILAALRSERLDRRVRIIGVPDVYNDRKWARIVMRSARFDAVVTGNEWTRRCLRNYPTFRPAFLEPRKYSSTQIRKRMARGLGWKSLVPRRVYEYIEKNKLV